MVDETKTENLTPKEKPLAARRRTLDPLGKRALFWVPGNQDASAERVKPSRVPLGRHALFSSAEAIRGTAEHETSGNPLGDRGPFVVECSSCEVVSRVGLLDFVIFQIPFAGWLPRGKFDRRMTCPACRHRVWASVTFKRD